MKKLIYNLLEMFKEAGIYSLNRVVPVSLIYASFLLFLGVTVFLICKGDAPTSWTLYSDMTTTIVAIIVAGASWLTGNKITNSKYNTAPGSAGKPMAPTTAEIEKTTQITEKVTAVVNKASETVNKKTAPPRDNDD